MKSSNLVEPFAPKRVKGGWIIREAVISDFPAIISIEEEIYTLEGPWSLEEYEDDFLNENTFYIVALDGEKIIGYAGARIEDGIGNLAVSTVIPEYRQKGIATEFLKIRLAWLDAQVKEVTLETRVDNDLILDHYKAYGFQATRVLRGYYSEEVDAIEMLRRI